MGRGLNKQHSPGRHRLAKLMKGNRFGVDVATICRVQLAVDEACAKHLFWN